MEQTQVDRIKRIFRRKEEILQHKRMNTFTSELENELNMLDKEINLTLCNVSDILYIMRNFEAFEENLEKHAEKPSKSTEQAESVEQKTTDVESVEQKTSDVESVEQKTSDVEQITEKETHKPINNRKMGNISTKHGDKGMTCSYDFVRVCKYNCMIKAVGSMDELSVTIGHLRVSLQDKSITIDDFKPGSKRHIIDFLFELQKYIQDVNSHIATYKHDKKILPDINIKMADKLQAEMDEMRKKLPPLNKFIIPGLYSIDILVSKCRVQTRATERIITESQDSVSGRTKTSDSIISEFINRLSDYFFILELYTRHFVRY
jgi:cob(I)alamin adenosyltransferase